MRRAEVLYVLSTLELQQKEMGRTMRNISINNVHIKTQRILS